MSSDNGREVAQIGYGFADLLTGNSVLVTGLEDAPDGALKVYVGPRYKGIYVLVDDDDAKATVRRNFGAMGHLFITKPSADRLWQDKDWQERREAARQREAEMRESGPS